MYFGADGLVVDASGAPYTGTFDNPGSGITVTYVDGVDVKAEDTPPGGTGTVSIAGVPVWAWIAGGTAVLVTLSSR